ncbi:MAG: YraN family protein [bacterium]
MVVASIREAIIIKTNNNLGNWGEDRATAYLQELGWEIVERNLNTPPGECDILARDGKTLVFVEVKTRQQDSQVSALESITCSKREKLRRMARWVISDYEQPPACRFDVIAITMDGLKSDIDHLKNAFGAKE